MMEAQLTDEQIFDLLRSYINGGLVTSEETVYLQDCGYLDSKLDLTLTGEAFLEKHDKE